MVSLVVNKARKTDCHSGCCFPVRYAPGQSGSTLYTNNQLQVWPENIKHLYLNWDIEMIQVWLVWPGSTLYTCYKSGQRTGNTFMYIGMIQVWPVRQHALYIIHHRHHQHDHHSSPTKDSCVNPVYFRPRLGAWTSWSVVIHCFMLSSGQQQPTQKL